MTNEADTKSVACHEMSQTLSQCEAGGQVQLPLSLSSNKSDTKSRTNTDDKSVLLQSHDMSIH